jgi:hypothetical protein
VNFAGKGILVGYDVPEKYTQLFLLSCLATVLSKISNRIMSSRTEKRKADQLNDTAASSPHRRVAMDSHADLFQFLPRHQGLDCFSHP